LKLHPVFTDRTRIEHGSKLATIYLMECPKIFIIEDDRDIRQSFEDLLKHEGYGVESFANGQEAIDRLYRAPEPCLILLDMLMPVMNGEEFMNHFHKLPATILPIPVFLVSATSSSDHSKKLGCRGFMKKPVDLDALLLIVKDFCQKKQKVA
jgi:two-component system chemotaxis response regulator CheY